jgi:hypothetical protein
MDIIQAFMERYKPLYTFYIGSLWQGDPIPLDLVCKRPYPETNSIAWNVWHLTRVEDAGLNLFVTEGTQVLEDGWMERMNIPWRHHGSGMSFAEVDELNQRINIDALHGYSDAVHTRTLAILERIDPASLDSVMEAERLRTIIIDQGLAHSNPDGLIGSYTGWSKVKCLYNFALTHPFLHIGEIDVIAGLLGVKF